MRNRKRTGISSRAARSIPRRSPRVMMKPESSITGSVYARTTPGRAVKAANDSAAACTLPAPYPPRKARMK